MRVTVSSKFFGNTFCQMESHEANYYINGKRTNYHINGKPWWVYYALNNKKIN